MTTVDALNPFIEHPAEYSPHLGGHHWTFKFNNGYGASVIQNRGSYGGPEGMWEIAVLGADGRLDYSTPITNDVIGWLSVDEARAALRAIAELPAA